ncbi:MAG: FAD-dependent oxidoreductase [Myxococcota bacterium]|nr:FAD-dependent oxidoreductase [Myxococcota bacterium]MEC8381755.1 FAD-dependent oxidoreductase [Myxococcota bacterium]
MKIVIAGNGIAGILLAERLAKWNPTIVAPRQNKSPTTALCHPFPGRSVQPHPLLLDAIEAACDQYLKWHEQYPKLCRPIQMHRPLVGTGGERLIRSAVKYRGFYAQSRIKINHSNPIQIDQNLSFKSEITQKLTYSPAFAIDLQQLIGLRLQELHLKGCALIDSHISAIGDNQITLQTGQTLPFDHLFMAVGTHIKQFFPSLKLIEEGGSLLQLPELKHTDAYSINGIHLTPNANGESVVGSTRWSGAPPSEQSCQDQLIQRIHSIVKAEKNLKAGAIWRGVRCINPHDRLPICGLIPNHRQVSVLAALGNKGLLWGPISALSVVNEALSNEPIPDGLSINRL